MIMRILVVEDNELVRKGLSRLLSAEQDIEVAGEASNGLEAIKLLERGAQPDLILADLNMPHMDGIELTGEVSRRFPEIKIIILTMHAKNVFAEKAMRAGAKGYLLKHGEMHELLKAIRLVATGETYVAQ